MLTSFFSKSNPINYLILGIFISIGYVVGLFLGEISEFEFTSIFGNIFVGLVLVFAMLLLDFIIRKNRLTETSTYGILFFSCFLMSFPAIFFERNILLASIFLMMALRRILSLRTDKNLEKKVLDSAIWTTLASFFYFWSILFFAVLYFSLARQAKLKYRFYFIPIAGFIAVFLVATSYYFLDTNSFDWFFNWMPAMSFDFSAYNKTNLLVPTTVILTLLVWTFFSRLSRISGLKKKERPNAIVLLFSLLVSILITLASPQKTGAEILFIFAPLSVILTNYIESISEFWFKELLLWITVLIPFVVFLL